MNRSTVVGNSRVYAHVKSNVGAAYLDEWLMGNRSSRVRSSIHIASRCYKDYHLADAQGTKVLSVAQYRTIELSFDLKIIN